MYKRQEAYRNAGLTGLCGITDQEFSGELDEGIVSDAFLQELSDAGVYIYRDEDNIRLRTVEPGNAWKICAIQRDCLLYTSRCV